MVRHSDIVWGVLSQAPDGLTALQIGQRCGLDSNSVRTALRQAEWAGVIGQAIEETSGYRSAVWGIVATNQITERAERAIKTILAKTQPEAKAKNNCHLSLYIPDDLMIKIHRDAAQEGVTKAAVVRRILEAAL